MDVGDITGMAGMLNDMNGPSGLPPELRQSGVPAPGGNGLNCP